MSIFKSKSQHNNTTGPLKVIEYSFEAEEFAYKYKYEDFASGAVLFVKPGQVALYVNEEQVEDFGPGRYELTSDVLLGYNKKANQLYNGNIYQCYIIFINKDRALQCNWGTPTPITFYSEKYKSTMRITSRGSYKLIVDHPIKFLSKTLGQSSSYYADDIEEFLFHEVIQTITSKIGEKVQKENVLFTELESIKDSLAKEITAILRAEEVFEYYGMTLASERGLSIETLKLHDEDMEMVRNFDASWRIAEEARIAKETEESAQINLERKRLEQVEAAKIQLELQAQLQRGLNEAEIMKAKGQYYAQERSFDVLQAAAENEGGANMNGNGGINLMTAGIGLGVGAGLGKGFAGAMTDVASSAFNASKPNSGITCPKCGQINEPNKKFCNECGTKLIEEIVCPSCGKGNPINTKFCNECGTKLIIEIVCPNCGKQNSANTKFCGECGTRLNVNNTCPDCNTENDYSAKFCNNCGKKLM